MHSSDRFVDDGESVSMLTLWGSRPAQVSMAPSTNAVAAFRIQSVIMRL
jgi:hypothetical protein